MSTCHLLRSGSRTILGNGVRPLRSSTLPTGMEHLKSSLASLSSHLPPFTHHRASSTSSSSPMPSTLNIGSSIKLSTGYPMPRLGLGVYMNDDVGPACAAAFAAGYRHVDSALFYHNEEGVGEAVRKSGIPRSKLFITSKVYSGRHGYEEAKDAVEESLASFEFDYLDLYLIHDPLSRKQKRLETWRALVEKQKEGKLRTIGVSNYGPQHLEEIRAAGLPTPAVNQLELHPWCQQKPIVDYCNAHGIVVQAYTPLTRGKHFNDPALVKISKAHNKSPSQVLVRWSLQRGFVPLPKSADPERVKANSELYDFELSAEEMKALDDCDRGEAGALTWNPVNAP
ncbi:Aldo/keto reductase [Calocera viscosa TUFC12733]|uniref:Aldo/keto reductase n=1 Tax=Calocera viscosa (strain TUFC12733) TaxID=1330018 RepID=A0A167RXW6_CALVF|nr:Aldo/keto reductase [Calocera viscosa TUFC12733]